MEGAKINDPNMEGLKINTKTIEKKRKHDELIILCIIEKLMWILMAYDLTWGRTKMKIYCGLIGYW